MLFTTKYFFKMTANKGQVDYAKIAAGLFSILIAISGWFAVTLYDRITKIEENVQQLLVASSAEKTEIQNLKERVNNLEGSHKDNFPKKQVFNTEGILPGLLDARKGKRYIAYK